MIRGFVSGLMERTSWSSTVCSVWMCSQNTSGAVCLCGSREGMCSWLIIQQSPPDTHTPPRISLLYLGLPADADSNIFVGLGGPLRRPLVPKTVIALQVSNLSGQTLNPLQINSFFSSWVEARARCKAAAKLCRGLRCLSIRRLPYTADSFSCGGNLSHTTATLLLRCVHRAMTSTDLFHL